MSESLETQLYQGNYKSLLHQSLDHRDYQLRPRDVPSIVGALTFTGRSSEAEALANSQMPHLSPPQRHETKFYLSINALRLGDKKNGLRVLLGMGPRRSLDARSLFFYYQGLAFSRYSSGQFHSSLAIAEKALEAAMSCRFFYGRMLALDLSGHNQVTLGQIHQGLTRMKQALSLADHLGHRGLEASLRVSILNYQLQYGVDVSQTVRDIYNILESSEIEDFYSHANLYLELARFYTRSGRFLKSESVLQKATQLIYQTSHSRQHRTLSLRYAELEYQRGDFYRALNFIAGIKSKHTESETHPTVRAEALGLELKLNKALSLPQQQAEIHLQDLKALAKKNQQALTKKYLQRWVSDSPDQGQIEDVIGQLKLKIEASELLTHELIREAIEIDCLTFLAQKLQIELPKPHLVFELIPSKVLVVSAKGYSLNHLGRSEIQLKLLKCLSQGWLRKEELVELVWGYAYDPLRHDPMLFSALQNLRKTLAPEQDLLERSELGYRLSPTLIVRDGSKSRPNPDSAKDQGSRNSSTDQLVDLSYADLNHRQIELLQSERLLRSHINLNDYIQVFEVSKVTASRDLRDLLKKGYLSKSGKARATRYCLSSN